MKKLIILSAALFFLAFGARSQSYDVKLDKGETFRSCDVTDGDTISGVGDEIGKVFYVNKSYDYTYVLQASADSITWDSLGCLFIMSYSYDGIKYWPEDSIAWSMSTPDTIVMFDGGSTIVKWRYIMNSIQSQDTSIVAKLGKSYLIISDN